MAIMLLVSDTESGCRCSAHGAAARVIRVGWVRLHLQGADQWRCVMAMTMWFKWWICEDPRPGYSALDRMDGLGAPRPHQQARYDRPRPVRAGPTPGPDVRERLGGEVPDLGPGAAREVD